MCHPQNEEKITRTHQQYGATGHIRNAKRDTRLKHTREYQLFIYLSPSHERDTHSTEVPTHTHTHTHIFLFLLPQKLPLHQAYTLRTQEANTPSTAVT